MTKKANQLCTASAVDLEPAAMLAKIREAGVDFQKCIAGLEDVLDEPLKTKFAEVKTQINTMLAGLPETDKVPAALASNDVLQRLLGVLSTAQMMISNLNETAKSAQTALASTKASIPTEVGSAIEARIAAGDLVKKEDVDKKISDATAAASTSARAAAITEFKRVNDRRLSLTTASIPVPGDEVLTGEDAAFDAKKATAAKRVEDLKPFKLEADRVLTLAWNTDEAAYAASLDLMKKAYEAAAKPQGANGFIGNRDGSEKTAVKRLGLC